MVNDTSENIEGASGSNKSIFVLLFVIPILAVLVYGSTDVWALLLFAPFFAVLGGTWIARSWRKGNFEINTDSIQLPLLGLLFLGVIQLLPLGDSGVPPGALSISASNALSLDPYWTRIFLVRVVGYIIFFAAALTFINSAGRFRKTVAVLIGFGGVLAFIGILQKLASPDSIYGVVKTAQAIPFGPYVNQHHFASLMVLLSGIAISHLLGQSVTRQIKLLIAISALIMAISVPLTSSRGGMISYFAMLLVGGAAYFYRGEKTTGKSWLPVLGAMAAVAVIAVGAVLFLGGADSLLRGVGFSNTSDDISSGRLYFWSVAWQIFTTNPVFGAGLDSFGAAFTHFDIRSGTYRVEQAHNDYLQMLADGGVVGFALLVAFIFLLVRKSLTRVRECSNDFVRTTVTGGLAGCVGILVHSFFDFPLRTAGNAFFFVLVVALMFAPVTADMFKVSARAR